MQQQHSTSQTNTCTSSSNLDGYNNNKSTMCNAFLIPKDFVFLPHLRSKFDVTLENKSSDSPCRPVGNAASITIAANSINGASACTPTATRLTSLTSSTPSTPSTASPLANPPMHHPEAPPNSPLLKRKQVYKLVTADNSQICDGRNLDNLMNKLACLSGTSSSSSSSSAAGAESMSRPRHQPPSSQFPLWPSLPQSNDAPSDTSAPANLSRRSNSSKQYNQSSKVALSTNSSSSYDDDDILRSDSLEEDPTTSRNDLNGGGHGGGSSGGSGSSGSSGVFNTSPKSAKVSPNISITSRQRSLKSDRPISPLKSSRTSRSKSPGKSRSSATSTSRRSLTPKSTRKTSKPIPIHPTHPSQLELPPMNQAPSQESTPGTTDRSSHSLPANSQHSQPLPQAPFTSSSPGASRANGSPSGNVTVRKKSQPNHRNSDINRNVSSIMRPARYSCNSNGSNGVGSHGPHASIASQNPGHPNPTEEQSSSNSKEMNVEESNQSNQTNPSNTGSPGLPNLLHPLMENWIGKKEDRKDKNGRTTLSQSMPTNMDYPSPGPMSRGSSTSQVETRRRSSVGDTPSNSTLHDSWVPLGVDFSTSMEVYVFET